MFSCCGSDEIKYFPPQPGLKIRKPETEESSTAMASVMIIFLLLIVLLFIVLIIMYGDPKVT